jgi:hypothetical protein
MLPNEALPLVIAGVGMLVMLHVMRPLVAVGFLFTLIVLPALVAPVIEALMSILPLWMVLFIAAAVILGMCRSALASLIGEGATDHVVGHLATDVMRALGRLLLIPFKVVGFLCRTALAPRRW